MAGYSGWTPHGPGSHFLANSGLFPALLPCQARSGYSHCLGSSRPNNYSILLCIMHTFFAPFLKRFYLLIFRERGREGEREGEKLQYVVASRVPPTGDLAHNPGMCPVWESNPRPFDSQVGTQSTEPHPQLRQPKFLREK